MKRNLLFVALMLLGMSNVFAQDYALKFDAVNETQSLKYKEDSFTQKLDGKNNFTAEIWVFPTSDTKIGDVVYSIRNTFRLTFWKNTSDDKVLGRVYVTLKEDVNDDGSTIKNSFVNTKDDAIVLNKWNHIAVISNSTDGDNGSIKIFVNGTDVTLKHYDAYTLDGGATNNDVFVGYGGGSYPTMYARELRLKDVAEDISNLVTDNHKNAYASDGNTAVLFHFNEGNGTTTVNTASGTNANLGYSGAHYPTWVNLSTLAIGNNELASFGVYPNPAANGFVTIQAQNSELLSSVEVFNTLGESVRSISVENESQITVGVSELTEGIYFIRATTDRGVATQKLLVK